MRMSPSELLTPFLGALQASISVLLTILFGVLTSQLNLLSSKAAKELSATCVRMFLPALLVYKVGNELHQGTAMRYLPILVWAIAYSFLSMTTGAVVTRVLKAPSWVTPALAFNNTTSLPLLLIESLDATGLLDTILLDWDTASSAIGRAESYFLVNAMVSNSLTFALGPRLLRPNDEDAPDHEDDEDDKDNDEPTENDHEEGHDEGNGQGNDAEPRELIDEESSLLPLHAVRKANRAQHCASRRGHKQWERLPPWGQEVLGILYQFANAPLLGALAGAIVGLTPPLHRWFFNQSNDGGYLNAWLTTSLKNIGDLFPSMQIIVVGVKLSHSLRKMKKGENGGDVPWSWVAFIAIVRFFFWPLISIPLIYGFATKTGVLNGDPMLWFAMMLMPTGPPAMILVALSDVNGSPEIEKMAIAKLLTISYAITPLTCFAVVGSLKAIEAAISV